MDRERRDAVGRAIVEGYRRIPQDADDLALVVTRDDAIPVLRRLVVAPVTRTIRGIPTEVPLGEDEGLSVACAASFDNLQPINRHLLTQRAGALAVARRHEVCRALDALADR